MQTTEQQNIAAHRDGTCRCADVACPSGCPGAAQGHCECGDPIPPARTVDGTYYSTDDMVTIDGRTVLIGDVCRIVSGRVNRSVQIEDMDRGALSAMRLDSALETAYSPAAARRLIRASRAGREAVAACRPVMAR